MFERTITDSFNDFSAKRATKLDESRVNLKTELTFDQDNTLAKSFEGEDELNNKILRDSYAVKTGIYKFQVKKQQENTGLEPKEILSPH